MTTWDQDLVQQVQEGRPGAFAQLVREYEPSLKRSVFQFLGDADAAADVTQDAFIATYENIHRFNPNHRFFSWVYRIAINRALNQIHRNRFTQSLANQDLRCPDPTPDAQIEAQERAARVRLGLTALDDKYRVLLILRHFLEFSYAEMAMVTGLPVSTVRSRLHTARVLLREELKKTSG
nr:sigma-70 family RNA polymerase sigma factor [Candidatus Krumholzibacteria bacterium]